MHFVHQSRSMGQIKLTAVAFVVLIVSACGVVNEKNKGKGFNLFSVEQDIQLGAQVAAEIDGNLAEYPVLDSTQNPEVYAYLYRVRDKILNTGQIDFKDEFQWRLRVIHDDSTLNAFCTPGGYIYIYTGILKYLDSEDQFAGVLGHEIAHADMRHSTRQMTKMYGVQILLDVLAGDRQAIKQVTGALIGLKNSRKHETEADTKSVQYLCPTDYNAAGGAGFFRKIEAAGGSGTPEFISTHPDPGNRVEHFENESIVNGCKGDQTYENQYKAMLAKLPK
ncbi:MAG: putative Zn-dependent protease [Flavobacteriaceae bacterium]